VKQAEIVLASAYLFTRELQNMQSSLPVNKYAKEHQTILKDFKNISEFCFTQVGI